MHRDQASGGLRHAVGLYRTAGQYTTAIDQFVSDGQARHEPVWLALAVGQLPPGGAASRWPQATVADMRQLGGNPARIMPAIRAFADDHTGLRVRCISEPVWPDRPAAEMREAARHDALLNLAFAGTPLSVMCLYDAGALPGSAIADACGSHPSRLSGQQLSTNRDYLGDGSMPASLGKPLVAPPGARELRYERDLRPVRSLVAAFAAEAGLSVTRRTDLVIAASEVSANTLRHTRAGGVIRLWATDDSVLCQIDDSGHIADPLAGHVRPSADRPGGQGLWLVNQICDLAEIRTSELGTTVRLCMHRDK
jgi:anti-sigma regulatory factor (Ser/Thr protein kinase)